MLSGEGNAGERWKTTIGLIRKKQLFTCSPLFLYISLPLFCTTTTWNFQKLAGYVLWRKCRTCSCSFFFSLPLIFTLVTARISYFSTAATNFHAVLPTKKWLLCIFSLSLAVCRYTSQAFRLLSLFLCLSPSLYSKFVEMTINLSLIRQHGCRNNFCFPFSSLLTL